VQRDCFPDGLHLIFRNVVDVEKLSGGICAIDLEAFVWARELLDEARDRERRRPRRGVSVEAQFLLTTLLSREQVDADRVIKEQISGMLAQDYCRLFREHRKGMTRAWARFGVVIVVSFQECRAWRRTLSSRAQRPGLVDQLAATASTIFPFG
jgi:hypothetical protein